jgi:hypothetical protein
MRAVLSRTQFIALLAGRPVVMEIPGGPDLELVLNVHWPASSMGVDIVSAAFKPPDPPQATEFLPARRPARRRRRAPP